MPIEDITDQPIRTPMWSGGELELVDMMLPAVVGFAISQVLLGLLLIALSHRGTLQQRLFGVLLLTLLGFFLAPFAANAPWNILVITLMTALPGVFWLFSASIFDDHFQLRPWQISLVLLPVLLHFIDQLTQNFGLSPTAVWKFVLIDIPVLLELLLVGLALAAVARHWSVDLVQSRRDLRLWFCGFNGSYLFIILILREFFYAYLPWLNYGQYATAALALLITNGMLLRMRTGLLAPEVETTANAVEPIKRKVSKEGPTADATRVARVEVADDVLAQLHDMMNKEHIYRDMGLTIGQLAYQLDLLEHQLRSVINGGLGYRNFNDFLNGYRVKEAAQRLSNPEEAKIPVTTIAMDVGYRSLSTFNKAFKSHFELTPTAYRRNSLLDNNDAG